MVMSRQLLYVATGREDLLIVGKASYENRKDCCMSNYALAF